MFFARPAQSASLVLTLTLAATAASCAPPMPASNAATEPAAAPAKAARATPSTLEPGDIATVRAKLATLMPDVALDAIQPSAVPGLYEIRRGSMYGYVTGDGQYLLSGDLVNLATGEEITENNRKQARVEKLTALDAETIKFDPPGGKPQTVVTVFTDVDCGYCRKLHEEVASYNALGIGIHYAFFPRSGPGSPSFQQAEAIWCSVDRKGALTRAKQGQQLALSSCKTPIQSQYNLGQELGLRGTPMMILPNGEIVNGYMPANRLAERIASASLPRAAKGAP